MSNDLFSILVVRTKTFLHKKHYSMLHVYGHLAWRKSFKSTMLLLHDRTKSIIGIFHKNAQLSYNKRQKYLFNVSRNNVS